MPNPPELPLDPRFIRPRARVLRSGIFVVALALAATLGFTPFAGGPVALAATDVGLFSSSVKPRVAAVASRKSVEVGVRFKSSRPGEVMALRFYRGSKQKRAYVGSLWSSAGRLLGRVAFARSSKAGWQTTQLAAPVSIVIGEKYVVSYLAANGRYPLTKGTFSKAYTRNGLTVPKNGGVTVATKISRMPTVTHKGTNYLVDVVFRPRSGSPATPTPVASATVAAPSATPSPTVTVTATSPAPSPSVSATATPSGSASATPSVSATATAPVALCGTSEVWANLDACGWAGPATTGYPDGQVFAKTVSGGLNVTTSGAVIDGYKITGGVTVSATNVVIRNSMISNSAGGVNGSGVVKILNGASATVENNVLDGTGATHTCIWHEGKSMVARGNECRNVNDGIFSWASQVGVDGTGDNFTIEDNWLHSFVTTAANGHVDGYQTEGAINGLIRHNTFDVAQDQTSAIAIWNGRKSASGITVDGNLIQGGGFSVYAEDYSPSEASPAGGYSVTNIQFTNNVFSHARYSCVGSYGVWFTRGAPTDGWRRSGNRLLETGQNLDSSNPVVNGWECR